jgi:hypothetical protein
MDNPANGHVPDTAATNHSVPSERGTVSPARPPVAQALACACGHLDAEHDAIATRYCLATTTGHLDRGCICAGATASQA